MLVSNDLGSVRIKKDAYLNALKKYRVGLTRHIQLHPGDQSGDAKRELVKVDSSINTIVNYSIDDYVTVPLGSKFLNHLEKADREATKL